MIHIYHPQIFSQASVIPSVHGKGVYASGSRGCFASGSGWGWGCAYTPGHTHTPASPPMDTPLPTTTTTTVYTSYCTLILSCNCNGSEKRYYLALFCHCRVDLVEIVVILLVIRIQHLVYPLTLSFIPNMMLLKRKASTYTYHFAL